MNKEGRSYLPYVNAAMRYFAQHQDFKRDGGIFPTAAGRDNWNCCESTLKEFSRRDRKKLLDLYSENDTMPDMIYKVAQKYGVDQDDLWALNNRFIITFARNRGLI